MNATVCRAAAVGIVAYFALTALGTALAAWKTSADVASSAGGVRRDGTPEGPAAVGVIDSVTDGRLYMNGLEIHFAEGTRVAINDRPAATRQLTPGQVVAIETRSTKGRLTAHDVAVLRVLEGPVTGVDPDSQTVFVMGQTVRVTGETRGFVQEKALEALTPGTTVHVSGHRNARGEVIASRIDTAPPGESSAIGRMTQSNPRTGDIGGLSISLAEPRVNGPGNVLVRGRWDGEQLRAGTVVDDPSVRLLVRVERAVVEGLVIEPRRGDSLRIGELQVRVPRGASIEGATDARRDQRVRVTGTPNRRGITAEQIEFAASAARSGGQTGSSEPVAEHRLDAGKDREQGRSESVATSTFSRPERSERMAHHNAALARAAEAPRARAERSDIVQRSEPAQRSEPSRTERSEVPPVERRPARAEHTGKPERAERSERSNRPEKSERAERSERSNRPVKPERAERSERSDRPVKPERAERSERSDKPEKSERAERSERPEKPEKSEKAERSQRSDRPVRVERAEKPEKPQRPQRLERPELPQRLRAAL
jgi:hypothetical protein